MFQIQDEMVLWEQWQLTSLVLHFMHFPANWLFVLSIVHFVKHQFILLTLCKFETDCRFLAATGQLYKRVCRSVGRSVGLSVGRSVRFSFFSFVWGSGSL